MRAKNLLAVTALLMIVSGAGAEVVTETYDSDAVFSNLGFAETFVAEGRIGDQGGAATFERKLWENTSTPGNEGQYTWPNGTPVDFTLSYDQGTNEVTFDVDGQVLTYNPGGIFEAIFIRTRATQTGTSILLDDLYLDGSALGVSSEAIGDGREIVGVGGSDLMDGFTLTGQSTMIWPQGNAPSNSHLAYQIKVGTVETDIPEPASMSLLSLGGLALLKRRKR